VVPWEPIIWLTFNLFRFDFVSECTKLNTYSMCWSVRHSYYYNIDIWQTPSKKFKYRMRNKVINHAHYLQYAIVIIYNMSQMMQFWYGLLQQTLEIRFLKLLKDINSTLQLELVIKWFRSMLLCVWLQMDVILCQKRLQITQL